MAIPALADIVPADFTVWKAALVLSAVYVVRSLVKSYRLRARSTALVGPPSPSWLFGVTKLVMNNPDAPRLYEEWVQQYGAVFRAPAPLGSNRIIITDPAAIAHFYSVETWTYVQTKLARVAIEGLFGRGLLWAEGESHRRQRKAISPAFSNVAVKRLTAVFYDSVYKLKANWDNQLAGVDSTVVDVQTGLNHVSLDSIGIAGFSHDFGLLEGKYCAVADVFDSMGRLKPSPIAALVIFFGNTFPILWRIPTETRRLQQKFNKAIEDIAGPLLENTRKEMQGLGEVGKEEKSIIGMLIKAESTESNLSMSQEEIMAQMKVLILAGYETTSISLTWALIELCRKPELQARLRAEIMEEFPSTDPTWEQLTNGASLRLLDAVVHEILRLHAPLPMTDRVAAKDDVIPLARPLRLPDGRLVDHLAVAEGEFVSVPISYMNTAREVWGADGHEFNPDRWLAEGGLSKRVQEVQGHRHLLTFVDGHRKCLGRGFALAEFKAILCVLIRTYTFELRDGPETKIEHCRGVLPRPRVEGMPGANVPMHIRRVE